MRFVRSHRKYFLSFDLGKWNRLCLASMFGHSQLITGIYRSEPLVRWHQTRPCGPDQTQICLYSQNAQKVYLTLGQLMMAFLIGFKPWLHISGSKCDHFQTVQMASCSVEPLLYVTATRHTGSHWLVDLLPTIPVT